MCARVRACMRACLCVLHKKFSNTGIETEGSLVLACPGLPHVCQASPSQLSTLVYRVPCPESGKLAPLPGLFSVVAAFAPVPDILDMVCLISQNSWWPKLQGHLSMSLGVRDVTLVLVCRL